MGEWPLALGPFVEQAAREPHRMAVRAPGRPDVDYGSLLGFVANVAEAVRLAGVAPEDRVATVLPAAPSTATVALGLLASACTAPVNPSLPEPALVEALARLDARMVVVAEDCPAWVRDAAARLHLPVAEVVAHPHGPAGSAEVRVDRLPARAGSRNGTAAQPALLLPTSGTTAASKLVPLSHANLAASTRSLISSLDLGPDDAVINVLPMHHIGGYVDVLLGPLSSGGSVTMATPFSAPETLGLIESHAPTWLQVAPAMLRELLAEMARSGADLAQSRLRFVRSVSAALPTALQREAQDVLGVPVIEIYGMTETAGVICSTPLDDVRPGSVGKPVALDVHVVDADGAGVPAGQTGEIRVRGEAVMSGYLPGSVPEGEPDAVVDGWLRTGDLGRLDDDGYLAITGRVKDVINRGGEMISPADVDRAMLAHPDVADAAAFGIPHPSLGESVAAIVVPRTGHDLDVPAFMAWLGQVLPSTMVPRPVVIRDEVPRVNGKVRRADLGALIPQHGSVEVGDETPLRAGLRALWCEVLGRDDLGPDDDFFAMGGDSLRAASLVALLGSRTDDIVYVSSVVEAPTLAQYEEHVRAFYPKAAAVLVGEQAQRQRSPRVSEDTVQQFRSLIAEPSGEWPAESRAPRAAFILSAPRSGSTLLRSMLAGHPDLFAPPELYLLGYPTLTERARAFPAAYASQLEGLDRALMAAWGVDAARARERLEQSGARTTVDAYRLLQDATAPRLLVDKTPAYALSVRTLERAERAFDDPVYIHLVRHPRAMIASFEEANLGPLWWPRIVGPDGRPDDLAQFTPRQLAELLWLTLNANIEEFLRGVPGERVVRLRFEELVTDPASALAPVCERLGIGFSPRLLDPYDDTSSRMTDGLHEQSRMIGDPKFHSHRGIDSEATDRWRRTADGTPLSTSAERIAVEAGYPDVVERPLSAGQQRLWSLSRLAPDSSLHTVPLAFRLTGPIDVVALDEALTAIADRHEVLRTVFPASADGSPTAIVRPPERVIVPQEDCSWVHDRTESLDAGIELTSMVEREVHRPFDVEEGPLWRARLLRVNDADYVLVMAFHHLVFDGLSRRILLEELSSAYAAAVSGQPWQPTALSSGYAEAARDLAEREQAVAGADHEYWRGVFAAPAVTLALPADVPPDGAVGMHAAVVDVPPSVADAVDALARETQSTPAAVWLAALAGSLSRWTGQDDVLVCLATSGRGSEDAQRLIGYFNRVVPVRLDLADDPRSADLIRRAAQRVTEAIDHDAIPMQEIAALPGLSGAVFSRALLEYQEGDDDLLALPDVESTRLVIRKGDADFDVAVHIDRTSAGVQVVLEADRALISPATADAMADALIDTVQWLADYGDRRISQAARLGVGAEDVAAALRAHPKVDDCVAVLRPQSGTVDAYLILDEYDVPTLGELVEHARQLLPAYRVPAHLVSVDQFPRHVDGSIDIEALPSPQRHARAVDSPPPRDDLERLIADAWREVLWTDDEVGVHDSFRDLGGHSLLSVQLVSTLEQRLDRRLPASALPRLDTIAGLAEALRAADAGEGADGQAVAAFGLPEDMLHGLLSHTATWNGVRHREGAVIVGLNTEGQRVPLFWCLQNAMEHEALARWLGPEQPVYAMRSGNRVMVKNDDNNDLLARYYVEEILQIRPEGPFLIGGNCQAASIAVRAAWHLRDRGHEVPLLVEMERFDPYPYDGPTAFVFGLESDRNPYLYYQRPELGYVKYVPGPIWIQHITGAHGHFFEEPNIGSLAATLEAHLDAATGGPVVPGAIREQATPLDERAYRAQVEVQQAPGQPLTAGSVIGLAVRVTNTSGIDWPDGPSGGMSVGCRWRDLSGTTEPVAATRLLDTALSRGEGVYVDLDVPVPDRTGDWLLEVDVVEQGVTWFQDRGSPPVRLRCAVQRSGSRWRRLAAAVTGR